MDRIELQLTGNEITVTLRRMVGNLTKVRRVSAQQAFALSTVLAGDAPEQALNFEVSGGVYLQIENRPYDRAWLGIDGRHSGRSLVACLEGDLIRKVGRCLHQLSVAAKRPIAKRFERYVFPIACCYIDE